MNKKLKPIGLLAVTLSLFTVTLMFAFGGDAYAVNIGTVDDGAGDKHFGSGTKGSMPDASIEKKAETVEAKVDLQGPYFYLIAVQLTSANSDNLYNAIFDVWAGDENVIDVQLAVKSDRESFTTMAGSFNAGDHSITTIKIRADDPSSIDAKILSWNINTGSENHLRP